jgi:hypothetical protein
VKIRRTSGVVPLLVFGVRISPVAIPARPPVVIAIPIGQKPVKVAEGEDPHDGAN